MAKSTDEAREPTMRYLIMNVARAFYDTRTIVILDQLARHEVLKDDELGTRSGMNTKELSKILHILISHGLVTVHRQNTSRTGETNARITSKGYYYIDHGGFCNIVKWRIARMRKNIEEQLKDGMGEMGYICLQCGKTFTSLDVLNLIRPGGLTFYCDQCDSELQHNQDEDEIEKRKDRVQRFNAQVERIREGLKQTEGMIMRKIDIQDWIKKHPTIAPTTDGDAPKVGGELAFAGEKPVTQKQVYEVVLTADDNLDQERLAREKEASARRQQNALPTWHTRSTVTGDITAFGLKNGINQPDELDFVEIRNQKLLEDHEDQKNSIEMYYAQLAAEDKAEAETPMDIETKPNIKDSASRDPLSKLSVPGGEAMSRTYSVSSLKRKLEDAEEGRLAKHSRSTSYQSSPPSPIRSKSAGSVSSSTSAETGAAAHMKGSEATVTTNPDEPTVFVNGKPFPLSAITEEHHDLMTPEEYETYAMLTLG